MTHYATGFRKLAIGTCELAADFLSLTKLRTQNSSFLCSRVLQERMVSKGNVRGFGDGVYHWGLLGPVAEVSSL